MTKPDPAPADLAAQAWKELARESLPADSSDLRLADAWATVPQGPSYYGVDSEGRWHLLVPLRSGETIRRGLGARGISVKRREFAHGDGEVRAYIDLTCERLELRRIFALLVDDLLREIRASAGAPQPVVIATLDRWRQLLGRGGALSDRELAGIFGELTVLEELARQFGPAAFDWWRGPQGGIHDFQREEVRLEVKTTMSHEDWKFRITGADQLEVPEGGELHVVMIRVHDDDAGTSVPEVIERLVGLGIPLADFLDRLRHIGYDPTHEEQYRELRLKERERRMAKVDDAFPAITRESFVGGALPVGTGALEYAIDVADVPLTLTTLDQALPVEVQS